MRILAILVAAGVAAAAASSVSAEDSHTIRVEPNNSYGATVTVEEGVRVFRPLPSERQVIVNPGQTPLGLNYYQFQQNGLPVVVPRR